MRLLITGRDTGSTLEQHRASLAPKPTIPEVIARFKAYHAVNPGWGSLHCVLGNGNTQDGFVDVDTESAAREQGDAEGADLIAILRRMSRTQRAKLRKLV
ncbi:hypothetical protein [Rhizobium chutanense]|uniref:Uncharacterized protein n=1 Tax=Rhizobium chutanense TaxID=2035448 RepID=A0A432P3W2_9HYPH|nr:hypothetical protein [Rhizobium chutanense]RUM06832.1 hypothetical protein EFR84_11595 [Rhizobium chutanense]